MSRLGRGDLFHRAAAIVRGCARPGLPAAAADRPCHVVAHRGAARLEAENTIPAFRRALELGADAIETDLSVTADGRFALWHDADPDERVALARQLRAETLAFRPFTPPLGSPWRRPVRELSADELERHYGYVPEDTSDRGDERVAIDWLEDLLGFVSESGLRQVYLDIKLAGDQTAAAEALVARLVPAPTPGTVYHLLCPQEEIVRELAASCARAGGPPHLRVSADLELPAPPVPDLKAMGAADVSLGFGGRLWPGYRWDVGAMLQARDRGHFGAVVAWTINARRKLDMLVGAGVDGILTDEPALLREIVASAGRSAVR